VRILNRGVIQLGAKETRRTVVRRSTDGSGWIVEWGNGCSPRSFFSYRGGAWDLLRDGSLGRQTAGTRDVRVPMSASGMVRFVRTLCAYEGEPIECES
jgi:hypothetical protein